MVFSLTIAQGGGIACAGLALAAVLGQKSKQLSHVLKVSAVM